MSETLSEERSICEKCGKEIVVRIETGGDFHKLTGTTRKDGTNWCLDCESEDRYVKQTIELKKHINKFLKIAKKVYICPVQGCDCKVETKNELASHILKNHNSYYGIRDLEWEVSRY